MHYTTHLPKIGMYVGTQVPRLQNKLTLRLLFSRRETDYTTAQTLNNQGVFQSSFQPRDALCTLNNKQTSKV